MNIVSKYYDAISQGYEELYGEEQRKKFEVIKELINFSGKILDVGCGNGKITNEIAEKGEFVVGMDISKGMISKAKKEKAFFIIADACSLPFKDDSFDIVISITVLQDIKEPLKALKEMKRVCKERILLSVLKRNWNREKLYKCILSCGLSVEKMINEERDLICLLKNLK